MSFNSPLWTIPAAFALVFLFDQICVRTREMARARQYAVQRQRRREIRGCLQRTFKLPPYTTQHRAQGLLDLLEAVQDRSIVAQDGYQRGIVRSAACLGLAFAAVAISVTIVHDIPRIKFMLAWVDLVALGFVLFHFRMARCALFLWIKTRASTELLRQYVFLSLLFPSTPGARAHLDLTSAFEIEQTEMAHAIIGGEERDLATAIGGLWSERRSSIANAKSIDEDLSPNILRLYVDRRCLRQLAWFRSSGQRLQTTQNDRTRVLTFLYGLSILFALSKVVLLWPLGHSNPEVLESLALALLLATGGAAAMSVLYFSQGNRSLIHRYNAQARDIEQWLGAFMRSYKEALALDISQARPKTELRDAILTFEDLMVKELIDWVRISQHDSIELGP